MRQRCSATLRGIAGGTDTLGLTHTDSAAVKRVMQAALSDAAAQPGQIRLVKTHGIGSAAADEAEAAALHALLPDTPRAALKPFIGHTLAQPPSPKPPCCFPSCTKARCRRCLLPPLTHKPMRRWPPTASR